MSGQTSNRTGVVDHLARRDQWVVIGALTLIVLLSAFYTVTGVGMNMSAVEMTRMARPVGQPMQMGQTVIWSPGYAVLIFLMWWIMMIAMMTPSAAPVILLFSALKRAGPDAGIAARYSLVFLLGYLLAWAVFSALATGLQWALESAGLSDGPMMTVNSRLFAGLILIAAGAYQLTALKQACLKHCHAPAQFLARHRRPGLSGALHMGAHHGVYCLGCCWALMCLLFVGGIMNLYWIAGLAIYVVIEKMFGASRGFTRATGAVLIGCGIWLVGATYW